MDSLSGEDRDIASDWVRKLRSRFTKLGLSSVGNPGPDCIAELDPRDTKAVKNAETTLSGYPKTERNRNRSDCLDPFSNESSCAPSPLFDEASNRTSPVKEIVVAPTTVTRENIPRDLEGLREKRLAYFGQDVPAAIEDRTTSLSNEIYQMEILNESKLNDSPSSSATRTRHSVDVSENRDGFYARPRRASSTSSWEKYDWEAGRFDEVQSPESDESPRFEPSEENVDFMLDWWGLKDQTTAPELRKYLPSSRNLSSISRNLSPNSRNLSQSLVTNIGNSENLKGQHSEIRDVDSDSEDAFHVFPVGFDPDEPELVRSFQYGLSDVCAQSSEDDSDFTVDDPVPKPKSPRVVNNLFPGNSPRSDKLWSRLSHSKSPPVPQIKGSLYHEFSGDDTDGIFEEVQRIPPDAGITVEGDEPVNQSVCRRPRSLSQPSIVEECCEKHGDVLFPRRTDSSISMCDFFQKKQCSEFKINCLQQRNNIVENGESSFEKDAIGVRPKNGAVQDPADSSSPASINLSNLSISCDESSLKKSDTTVLVCPECGEINSTCANWCVECGLALVGVKLIKQGNDTSQPSEKKSLSCYRESTQNAELVRFPMKVKSEITGSSANEKNSRRNSWKGLKQDNKQDGRRWEKSSLAWNTYKDSHLSKPPAVKNHRNKSKKNIATEGIDSGRPRSASCKNSGKKDTYGSSNPGSGANVAGSWPKSNKPREFRNKKKNAWSSVKNSDLRVKGSKTNGNKISKKDLAIDLSGLDDYAEMIRTNRGKPLPYLCLPDEIILRIFRELSQQDLASCLHVCWQFNRICQDECLWKTIVLRRNQNVCDEFLEKIGSRKPVSLSLIQCRGSLVTAGGLRELFRRCADNLEELSFSGCNGGQLIGESILLHVALRCNKLRSVDASWSNVGDNGIEALVENIDRLECLCLNGCQAITDHSLKVIADKHGESLRTFEIFGCFNVTAPGIKRLGQKCPNLQTLNLGQCYKITSAAIGQLVSRLGSIVNLDLRGCKQARDACVRTIAKHCPHLVNLVLANCPLITDVAMAEIATNLPSVRCLDVCGCAKVTDDGVRALARSCSRLNYLDLSSTSITQKSVMLLANYCSQNLESLKLSFCVDVTNDSVSRLVKHCKRMTTLHLYGCKRLRNVQALQKLNQSLKLEF